MRLKIKRNSEIDFWKALCHDNDDAFVHPFPEEELREKVNKIIDGFNEEAGCPFYEPRFYSPEYSGLDRWTFVVGDVDDPTHYSDRCHSKADVKKLLPKQVHEWIDKLNKMEIVL